ncbi:hypothetical protein [Parabacteroides leei]|uniref:hypothetical protein n=1 Tax=Parabacteroides leei TaxID=2939491 RepID=UPI00189B10B3|nr:hypothetical protein [Parabacteroides goldsteinii]
MIEAEKEIISEREKIFWLNEGQFEVFNLMPRRFVGICSRRFGKTHGLQGPYLIRIVSYMPRGKSFIYCATLKQGLTRTIPGTIAAIEDITGMKHGVHFFVGCKAPKSAQFDDPIVRPYNWEHCIHWYNGHVTHILSQDIKFSANSLTLDGGLIDEARIIKKEKVDQELMPAISGTPGHFEDCPLKKSIWITTDRPLTREGQWVIDLESQVTVEIEQQLKESIDRYLFMEKAGYPQKWLDKEFTLMNELRRDCYLYREFNTLQNLAVVGLDYIKDMERILPKRIFDISILNKRVRKAADGFYSAFDSTKHTYVVESADKMEDFRITIKPTERNRIRSTFETYDFKRLQEHSCFLDLDIDHKQSLNIAFDYNANINWVVTGQKGNINGVECMMVLSSMFVKDERKLRELCDDWANYYEPHRINNNRVNFYYNQTAKQKRYANNDKNERFYETVIACLRIRGWSVNAIDMGEAMLQMSKFYLLDDAFKHRYNTKKGKPNLFPYLNRDNNEYLIAAIENTETSDKYDGFGKNKSGEKKADSDEDRAELRTDGTDAFDDLFIGMNNFYQEGSLRFPGITVR